MNNNSVYEIMQKYSTRAMTNRQLLAVVIGGGGEKALDLAEKIMNEHKTLNSLSELTLAELKDEGCGAKTAARIQAVTELATRMRQERYTGNISFTSPGSVAEYYMEPMRKLAQEEVVLIMLDSHLHLIKDVVLSKGTSNRSYLVPRDVFRVALKSKATNIMLLHNHPSGDPTPSKDDIETSQRIHKLGEELEVRLIDHIVIGDNRYVSLKECGIF